MTPVHNLRETKSKAERNEIYNNQLTDEQINVLEWQGEDLARLSAKELQEHLLSDDHEFEEVCENGVYVPTCRIWL